MVNFFSYFLTCANHSTMNDVIGKFQEVLFKTAEYFIAFANDKLSSALL